MLTTARKPIVNRQPDLAPKRGVGVVKGNPERCIICRKKIQAGDRWLKYTSPSDPDYAAYSLIVHEECERNAR